MNLKVAPSSVDWPVRFRAAREAAGLTVTEAAGTLGLHQEAVSRYESRARQRPSVDLILAMIGVGYPREILLPELFPLQRTGGDEPGENPGNRVGTPLAAR